MLNIALARQSRTAPQLADAMLLLVAVIWGSSYAATKQALAFYPVLGFIALRFTLTFLVLVPQLRGAGLTALRPGLPLGLILLGVFICETQGVAIISAGNAAFLISLFVIFTPLVEWLMCRGRLDGRLMLAALLSLLGVYWLCGGSALRLGRGEWLVIAAALLRACLVCDTRRLTAQRPVPALALTAVQTGVVAAGSWLLLLFTFRQPPPLPASWQFWGITLYLALFATLFAFFAQNYAAGRTSPSRLSLLLGTEPLFGALLAALLLNEHLTALGWVGGGCIVASLLMVLTRRTPPQQVP